MSAPVHGARMRTLAGIIMVSVRMSSQVSYLFAAMSAWMHCAFRHGVDPMQKADDFGTTTLYCSVCGRVFWRRRSR